MQRLWFIEIEATDSPNLMGLPVPHYRGPAMAAAVSHGGREALVPFPHVMPWQLLWIDSIGSDALSSGAEGNLL